MRYGTVLVLFALPALATGAPPQTTARAPREQTVFVNDQQSLTPGYAVGNIAIGDPKVADFKVMPGRLEILLFGKGPGQTRLTLWDQKNVKRDEILITVTTRQSDQLERDLREMLKDFPSVEVRMFAGSLAVTGAVSSKDDLEAIEKIATAAKVRSLVRYVAPTPAAPPPPAGGGAVTPGGGPPAGAAAGSEVEYEVELLEASARFRSGSYATGVEPSGRSLYKGIVRAPFGTEREVFIGGDVTPAGKGKAASGKGGAEAVKTGIRLTLTPQAPDSRGRFKTLMLVETNLPFSGETYDPNVWRRARWEFAANSGEPFGITGADLLATPDAAGGGGSKLGTTASVASRLTTIPGVALAPGAEYVPVFGSLFGSRAYKQKSTQLLVIVRPRVRAPQS